MRNMKMRRNQSGFTLIELVVVIVILGILAATAIPRFADMSTEARMAKMKAAQAALQTGSSLFHAQWLVKGAPTDTTPIAMEGVDVPYSNGYPSVNSLTTGAGITIAAGGLADYQFTSGALRSFAVTPDSTRVNCAIVYTETTSAGFAPSIDASLVTTTNCQ